MSRHRRAALLTVAAVVAGGLGIALVSGYSRSVSEGYGRLRPVVVVSGAFSGGRKLTGGLIRKQTEVRQVPARFVPAGALADPGAAVGFETAVPLARGSYLTAGSLRRPSGGGTVEPRIGRGRIPVELSVSGAAALSRAGAPAGTGARVDVLVTREGPVGGSGSTRLAARRVPLIATGGPDPGSAGAGLSRVVLGLTRSQAIELIDAETFARRLTVIAGAGR